MAIQGESGSVCLKEAREPVGTVGVRICTRGGFEVIQGIGVGGYPEIGEKQNLLGSFRTKECGRTSSSCEGNYYHDISLTQSSGYSVGMGLMRILWEDRKAQSIFRGAGQSRDQANTAGNKKSHATWKEKKYLI